MLTMHKGYDIHSATRKLRYAQRMYALYTMHECTIQANAWNAECERMNAIVSALG